MRWRRIIHAEGVFGEGWQRQAISSTPEACGLGSHHQFQAGTRLTGSARSDEAFGADTGSSRG
jgi:hypothetical protein